MAVAVVGFVTGYLAVIYGLKPYPFYLGILFAIAGFLILWLIVKDTKKFTLLEIENHDSHFSENKDKDADKGKLSFSHVFIQTSWRNRSLLAISQAGLINNLIFGVSWGLFTIYFSSFALNTNDIGLLKALHPGIWGILQLLTGSLSDKVGRKVLIFPRMFIQLIGIWIILYSRAFPGWTTGMSLLGENCHGIP